MKFKSHKSKWAMALCAVAALSFTAVRDAHGGRVPGQVTPGPLVSPVILDEPQPSPAPTTSPVISPLGGGDDSALSGTFTGTMIID
jgi:hypothetical protein